MERVVARETPADHRCPYCHDALAGGGELPADDLVECDGCRTRHHRACIEELGRCTIRGCERSLHVEPRAEPATPVEGRRSAVQREVQARLRERARTFVQAHTRAVGEAGGRAAVEAAIAAARAAEAAEEHLAASESWHQVARQLTLARSEELTGLGAWELGFRGTTSGSPHLRAQQVADAAEQAVERANSFAARHWLARMRRPLQVLAGLCLLLFAVLVGTMGFSTVVELLPIAALVFVFPAIVGLGLALLIKSRR